MFLSNSKLSSQPQGVHQVRRILLKQSQGCEPRHFFSNIPSVRRKVKSKAKANAYPGSSQHHPQVQEKAKFQLAIHFYRTEKGSANGGSSAVAGRSREDGKKDEYGLSKAYRNEFSFARKQATLLIQSGARCVKGAGRLAPDFTLFDFKLLAPIVYWSNGLTAGYPSMKMLGKWRGITRIQYEQSGNSSYLSDFGIRLSPLQQGLRERLLAPTDTTVHYREPALAFTSKSDESSDELGPSLASFPMNLSISGVPADWLVPRVFFFPFFFTLLTLIIVIAVPRANRPNVTTNPLPTHAVPPPANRKMIESTLPMLLAFPGENEKENLRLEKKTVVLRRSTNAY
ncbi:hypothetical protein ACOSP7_028276 [Xanthoceras sorbifolium]